MSNTTHLTLSILESDLTDLCILTERIAEFAEPFETAEQLDEDKFDETLAGIAKALNPGLSDDEANEYAQIPVLTYAANKACRKAQFLLSTVKLAQGAPKIEVGLSVDQLIENCRKTGSQKKFMRDDRDGFLKILAWVLKIAVEYIASSGLYQKDPYSNVAIGLRMMGVILLRLEELGFSFDEPPDGNPFLHLVASNNKGVGDGNIT